MPRRIFSVLVVLIAASAFAQAPAPAPPAPDPLRTAADRPVDLQHIRLDLRVDLPKKSVDAVATLSFRSLRPVSSVSLDAVDFEVKKVSLGDDNAPLHFSQDGKKLDIDLAPAWPAGQAGKLRIEYRIREPKAGLHFFGPTEAEPNVPLTVWSQGEAITNRYWIPCFDHPDQRQTSELIVTVPDGFEALSNGRLEERGTNADKSVTFHWKQDKPHVSYLITLVVGQFDIIREEWHGKPVLYYVPKGKKDDVARTFGRTREMLDFFTKRYGIDYPWEKYAQVVVEQFTSGGMENTSATTLTDRALHDARAALDSSPDGLIAHELAHQWWGDLITCRDWAHIWLNEGFATFAEVLWMEHSKGTEEAAYLLLQKARSAQKGGKERPVVDRRYSSAVSMFDARAYPKGAWVLHMLRHRVGEEAFWQALRRYGTEHRLKSVETSDFRKTFERETGHNLERFFYDWTERPGHPVLEITSEYQAEGKQVRIAIKQTQAGEAFQFPLTIGVQGPAGTSPVTVRPRLTEKEHVLLVPLAGRPTRIDIDPEQTVLAEIKETKSRELWQAQLKGADVAGRVRAAEHFGKSKTPADRELLALAFAEEKFWGVQAELAAALAESGGDTCRQALVDGLKHAHPKVRRACAEQLGKFPRDGKAAEALKGLLARGDASYFVESAALTAYAQLQTEDAVNVLLPWLARESYADVLRRAALDGLGSTQDLAALDTLVTWTHRGKSRYCRMSAIGALGKLAQKGNPSDHQRQQIVKAVAACLEGESPLIRRTATGVLRDLGRSATPSLTALEALARHDADDRVRELAQKAIEQIRSNAPAPVEVTRLREELERLKKSQDELKERLSKYEKVERIEGK
jgi:aminopeptidase N